MKNVRPILGIAASLLLFALPAFAAGGSQLVRVYTSDRAEVRNLADSGADIVRHGDGWVEVVVPARDESSPQAMAAVGSALARFERKDVLVKDLDAQLARRFKGRPDLGIYHTVQEAHDELASYASEYPAICRVENVGKTFEGRNIEALVVGPQGADASGKPRFLFCGAHHSREWISIEVPLALAKKLVTSYATDPDLKALVDSRVTWIIPVLSPDGVTYSQTNSQMWRKNRRKNKDGSYGVDPNRNYGYKWGGAGASTYPGSDTYRGESGFSEAETQAIRDLAVRERFSADISFHSYSELVFWPWSYSEDHIDAAHETIYKKHAVEMARLTSYTAEKSSDLYCSSGDYDDFLFGQLGACSFTIELGQEFIPREGEVAGICESNVAACLYALKNLEDPFPRMTHTPPAAAGTDGTPVTVQLRKDLYPNDSGSAVSAVYSTGDGAVLSLELPAVAGQAAQFSGTVPAGAASYHFETKAHDGQTVRWPPFREFAVPTAGH